MKFSLNFYVRSVAIEESVRLKQEFCNLNPSEESNLIEFTKCNLLSNALLFLNYHLHKNDSVSWFGVI